MFLPIEVALVVERERRRELERRLPWLLALREHRKEPGQRERRSRTYGWTDARPRPSGPR